MITQSLMPIETVQRRMDQVLSSTGCANDVLEYTKSIPGKRLRPLLVLLTSDLCRGIRFDDVINAAAGVELVHMASLIHDDIIDHSEFRRGQPTLHRKFGTQVAVLAGDHLFAAAFHLFSLTKSSQVSQLMTTVIQQMCTGEINQLQTPLTTENEYWSYIYQKTACFLGGCCRLGAVLSEVDELEGMPLQEFGENMGLAFQLTDDVLDYRGEDLIMGKKGGRDFEEGLWTLPIIRAYQRGLIPFNWSEQGFGTIQAILEKEGVLDEVWSVAGSRVRRATAVLERFPKTMAKDELLHLANQLLIRKC